MKAMYGVLLVLLAFGPLQARAYDMTVEDMLNLYNKYHAVMVASELCPMQPFTNAADKAKFLKNFRTVRFHAARAIKTGQPELNKQEDLVAYMKSMDDYVRTGINGYYKDGGCLNPVLQEMKLLHWEFRQLPVLPE